jgi:hypothetical protein
MGARVARLDPRRRHQIRVQRWLYCWSGGGEVGEAQGEDVMRKFPSRPSRRSIRNSLQGMSALALGTVPVFEAAPARKKTGRQKESLVNDAAKEWARARNGVLYRNRRGMVELSSGAKMPIGLGPNGTGDLIGYMRVRITPEMVGRVLPIYTEIESKTDSGKLAEHQQARIEELRDVQAIAGCVRNVDDCEQIMARWRDGYVF